MSAPEGAPEDGAGGEPREAALPGEFVKGRARLREAKREVAGAMLEQAVRGAGAFMGLACGGSVFLVGFFPFHVGSGHGAGLRVARGALAPHHFSIVLGRDSLCYLVPCCDWGIEVDGVLYRYGVPRVPLWDGSVIRYRALRILVHIPGSAIPAQDAVRLSSSGVRQFEVCAPL